MTRLRRNWPAFAWAVVMIGGPSVLHVIGVRLPEPVAWPVGVIAPFASAARRALR